MLLSLLVVISFVLRSHVGDGRQLYGKIDYDFRNKNVIKNIQIENGDILDCFDIHKQPAFNNPRLKNHKLQMAPTFDWKKNSNARTSPKVSSAIRGLKDGACPQGSVPILRPHKGLLQGYSPNTSTIVPTEYPEVVDKHVAVQSTYEGVFYGAAANLNVWRPMADGKDQYSALKVSLSAMGDFIEAGWMVNNDLEGDHRPRSFIRWTADNFTHTGCYNLYCEGFVQVSKNFLPGLDLHPWSVYLGAQFEITIVLQKDNATSNWWLILNDDHIGYWPRELFTGLGNYSNHVLWGAETYKGPANPLHPEMGSGQFAKKGFKKACYMSNLALFNSTHDRYAVWPEKTPLVTTKTRPWCHDLMPAYDIPNGEYGIYVGGPGGKCD